MGACSHFFGYTTNLFTCRLTYLAPFARAQFLVKLGGFRLTYFFLRFLSFSHNLLLLQHAWSDFDQTWSEWPVGEWLQKLSTVWPQRSCRGHRGQKGHFKGKCYSSYMVHRILTKLGQNNQQASGYKSYQQFDLKGHVGVTEVKKAILKENATPPTWFIGFWRNLVRITSRQVATKVINSLTLKVM